MAYLAFPQFTDEDTRPIVRVESVTSETDTELRMRLIYIGVSPRELATIDLDRLAEQYSLERRMVKR